MTSEDQHGLPAGIYRQLFEYAADPILILDFAGNFIEANQAACDHLGYSREELLHMRPEHLMTQLPARKFPSGWRNLKESGKPDSRRFTSIGTARTFRLKCISA